MTTSTDGRALVRAAVTLTEHRDDLTPEQVLGSDTKPVANRAAAARLLRALRAVSGADGGIDGRVALLGQLERIEKLPAVARVDAASGGGLRVRTHTLVLHDGEVARLVGPQTFTLRARAPFVSFAGGSVAPARVPATIQRALMTGDWLDGARLVTVALTATAGRPVPHLPGLPVTSARPGWHRGRPIVPRSHSRRAELRPSRRAARGAAPGGGQRAGRTRPA